MPTSVPEENISNTDLYNTLKSIIKQNEEIKEELKTFKIEIKSELQSIKEKNKDLEQENKLLKNRLINIERKSKKYNLVIYGLEETEDDIIELILDLFSNKLDVNCNKEDIRDAYRMGAKVNEGHRPVTMELLTVQLKNEILFKSNSLRKENIYFSQDYIKEDWEKRKVLQLNLKEAKKEKLQATIKKWALVVEDKVYTYEDLIKKPIKEIILQDTQIDRNKQKTRIGKNKKKPNN